MTTSIYQLPLSDFSGPYDHRKRWLSQHTHRVQILIAANEALRVLPLFEGNHPGDSRPRRALELALLAADGIGSVEELRATAAAAAAAPAYAAASAAAAAAAASSCAAAASAPSAASYAASAASYAASCAAYAAPSAAAAAAARAEQDRRLWQYLPVPEWSLRWHTPDTVAIATRIYDAQDWSLCPILADTLMDAGCENGSVLGMLQSAYDQIGRGCWVVDRLSEKFLSKPLTY